MSWSRWCNKYFLSLTFVMVFFTAIISHADDKTAARMMREILIKETVSSLNLNRYDLAHRWAWYTLFFGANEEFMKKINNFGCSKAERLYISGANDLKSGLIEFAKSKWGAVGRLSSICKKNIPSQLEVKYEGDKR